MSGLRARKKSQAREALVDVAMRLFSERGIDATSVDDIADAAQMSRGTFFNYFPYKEAILVEIGARFVSEIANYAARHNRRMARHALYDLADAIAAITERYPTLVAHIAREMTHLEPSRRRFAADGMRYPMLYQELLSDLRGAGLLRWPGRRVAHERQLVDLTTGVLVRAGSDVSVSAVRAELRANVDLFCEGAIRSEGRQAGR